MSKKEMTDEELEEELEKVWKTSEAQKDRCGTPLPSSRETGVQKDNVKMKDE
jgi:hypothetical protein